MPEGCRLPARQWFVALDSSCELPEGMRGDSVISLGSFLF